MTEDPLAATLVEASASGALEAPHTIGRYRVDRVLGKGAMGTVYAAYDADLDRAIALKVLHGARTSERHVRLLREARAMARLDHPNVVRVYEVGTDNAIDFVAMELVDGGSLEGWIKDPAVTAAAKLAAFIQAGRGLAAAHAAGLVHRDFKPHNVLRAVTGRVLVTDFGLARGDGRSSDPAIASPNAMTASPGSADLSASLTRSGAMLGTPAYMAPEQYSNTAVEPAADQFSFCVALWEALAGRRPFRGPTLFEQRAAIDRGPDPRTEAAIPRWLRPILRRGLRVDPAARWPSMDALLAALQPRRRRWPVVVAAALLAGALAVALARRGDASCDDILPYRASPSRAALLARGPAGADVIAPLDVLADDWTAMRVQTCGAPASVTRAQQLACLDVVRDELALASDTSAEVTMDLRDVDAASAVGDPHACAAAPARAAVRLDPHARAIARFLAEEEPAVSWPAEQPADPPCLRASWLLARATQAAFTGDRTAALRAAADQAEGCGDDRLRAVIAVIAAEIETANPFGLPGALHRAELAVARAGGDRILAARVGLLHAIEENVDDDVDGAIAHGVAATDALAAQRAYTAVVIATSATVDLLGRRGTPGDLATSERLLRAAIPHAGPRSQRYLAPRLAMTLWHEGKLDAAHAAGATIDPGPVPDGIVVRGVVVDADGTPVPGALVVAADDLVGDARAIAIAPARHAMTDRTGTFEMTGVGRTAVVAAEVGLWRSAPVRADASVTLHAVPSGTITGRIAGDARGVEVRATSRGGPRWSVLAPVAADGTFELDGVVRGPARVVAQRGEAAASHDVEVGDTAVGPIELALTTTTAPLSVVVRSEVEGPLQGATIWAIQGRVAPRTLGELAALTATQVRKLARVYGDHELGAMIHAIALGDVTVCAAATGDLDDPSYVARLTKHGDQIVLTCKTIALTATTGEVELTVPAPNRLPD